MSTNDAASSERAAPAGGEESVVVERVAPDGRSAAAPASSVD